MYARSLQAKLVLLFVLSLGLPLAAALFSLARLNSTAQELDRISRQDFQAQQTVARATIRFKQQVQEWKDVLLRGKDPAALDKYWGNFTQREDDTAAAIREARDAIAYDDLRAKLDEFLKAHQAAGEKYRAGLEAFKASQFDSHAGDQAVAGIDRPPTELLLESERIARERGAAAVAKAVQGARNAYLLAIATTVVAIGAALVMLWLFVRRTVVEPIREGARFAARVAQGDLTGRIAVRSRDEVGQLQDALAKMNSSLAVIVEQMRAAAESVAVASGQVVAGTGSLSAQTEEQASSLEETAASMEELATTVQQNADSARKADELARGASTTARTGGDEVANVVATMGEISTASKQIAEIVTVIDSIAFQTNILALNAAVEAARAGEQGRGFAVVAAEVRSLAQRCASAAKEIKQLIDRSAQRIESGASVVERAGVTIGMLVANVGQVTELMSSIAEASGEQARGVQQINRTVTEMDKTVQQNASAVQQSAAAAEGMRRQAEEMVRAVSAFRLAANEAAFIGARPAAGAPIAPQGPVEAIAPARAPAMLPARKQRRGLAAAQPVTEDWTEF
jgi:methyl-accepting chemotaxis protein-1 (serine sensor receptor)